MRTILSLKKTVPVASAMAVAMLIAVIIPATASALTTSSPLLANLFCVGNVQNSKNTALIPEGNLVVVGSFLQLINTDVPPFGKRGTVSLDLGFIIQGSCKDQNVNGQARTVAEDPCIQTAFCTGPSTPYTGKDNLTAVPPTTIACTFQPQLGQVSPPSPPGAPNSDPFVGCTATFEAFPMTDNVGKPGDAANLTFSLDCAGTPMAGTQMSMECQSH